MFARASQEAARKVVSYKAFAYFASAADDEISTHLSSLIALEAHFSFPGQLCVKTRGHSRDFTSTPGFFAASA